jgi:predicted phosphodiesterase
VLDRLWFISDVHSPAHDKKAWRLVLDALADFKPDVFVSLGDFMDLSSVSHWSKDPNTALDLAAERTVAETMLAEIETRTEGARRIYVAGNHEDRLKRFLQDKAPQFFNVLDIPKLLRLEERGWEYVPYKQSVKVGKLHITHDVGSAGRYNVYKALDTFQSPVVTGHTHRLGYVVEGDATGDSQVSAQFGWLGDVEQVDYMHRVKARRDWTLGFGYGYVNPKSGYAYLVPVPIVDYTAVVEGRLYRGRR